MPKQTQSTRGRITRPAQTLPIQERRFHNAADAMLDGLAARIAHTKNGSLVLNGAIYLTASERRALDELIGASKITAGLDQVISGNLSHRIEKAYEVRGRKPLNLFRDLGLWLLVTPLAETLEHPFSGGYVIDVVDARAMGKDRRSD